MWANYIRSSTGRPICRKLHQSVNQKKDEFSSQTQLQEECNFLFNSKLSSPSDNNNVDVTINFWDAPSRSACSTWSSKSYQRPRPTGVASTRARDQTSECLPSQSICEIWNVNSKLTLRSYWSPRRNVPSNYLFIYLLKLSDSTKT